MRHNKKADMSLQKVIAFILVAIVFLVLFLWSPSIYSKAHDGIETIKFSSSEKTCEISSENSNIFDCDKNVCTDEQKQKWKSYLNYLNDKTCSSIISEEIGVAKDKACTCIQQKIYAVKTEDERKNTYDNLKTIENSQNNVYNAENKAKIISTFQTPNGEMPSKVKTTIENLKKIDINGKTAYDYVIEKSIEKNLDPYLVIAVISQESTGNNFAISPTGCAGLFQFCYQTAFKDSRFSSIFQTNYGCELKSLSTCTCWKDGVKTGDMKCSEDARFNSKLAIDAGINYLYILSRQYNNDFELILTAYNAGSSISNKCMGIDDNQKQLECIKTAVSTTYSSSKVTEVNTYISNIKSYRMALNGDFNSIYS